MEYDFEKEEAKTGTIVSALVIVLGAVIIFLVLLFGWFLWDSKQPSPAPATAKVEELVKNGVSETKSLGADAEKIGKEVLNKTKDAAAEVPQAASDAFTKGDQKTTRPNKDGSTDKLDQKP